MTQYYYIYHIQEGISPLRRAVLQNHIEVARVLLENGAPTDSFDKVDNLSQYQHFRSD